MTTFLAGVLVGATLLYVRDAWTEAVALIDNGLAPLDTDDPALRLVKGVAS